MSKKIKIYEVGPRDGLQNESQALSVATKVQFIEHLIKAGHQFIELGSFVRDDLVPQMSSTQEVVNEIMSKYGQVNCEFSCLVPNLKGLELAMAGGLKHIGIFTSPSNKFNQKNIGTDVKGSLERLTPVIKKAKENSVHIRAYLSTVFGCPYEGMMKPELVSHLLLQLKDLGVDDFSLGDTIGVATPGGVAKTLSHLLKDNNPNTLAMHFHDTYGFAVANSLESYRHGIDRFDSSSGGLGGCPYAGKGASGNVASEDLIRLFRSLGLEVDIDFDGQLKASEYIFEVLGKKSASKFVYQKLQ